MTVTNGDKEFDINKFFLRLSSCSVLIFSHTLSFPLLSTYTFILFLTLMSDDSRIHPGDQNVGGNFAGGCYLSSFLVFFCLFLLLVVHVCFCICHEHLLVVHTFRISPTQSSHGVFYSKWSSKKGALF